MRGMNNGQRITLWIATLVFVAMSVFPPWVETWAHATSWSKPYGYRLLFAPAPEDVQGFQLDLPRLFVQWAALAGLAALAVALVGAAERLSRDTRTLNPMADRALAYALVGLLFLGLVLGPLAMWFANRALNQIEAEPERWRGTIRARVAAILGLFVTLLCAVALVLFLRSFR